MVLSHYKNIRVVRNIRSQGRSTSFNLHWQRKAAHCFLYDKQRNEWVFFLLVHRLLQTMEKFEIIQTINIMDLIMLVLLVLTAHIFSELTS